MENMETLKLTNGEVVKLPVSEKPGWKRFECTSRKQVLEVSFTLLLLGNVCHTICMDSTGEFAVEVKIA